VAEVRAGLSKLQSVKGLKVELKPPRAQFNYDPEKVVLQEVVSAIRGAGSAFDGKVLLQHDPKLTEAKLEELDKALENVEGVKNTGAPDEKGLREITLDLKKKTSLADLVAAGKSAGVVIRVPEMK
jgi:copper chaperone CopZ